jgi:hypothetical protein
MNNGKLSKTDIENNFVQILDKYPKSIEKTISICFDLILDCFVVMFGEKKTIKLLDEAKKSVREGNHTQNAVKTRKTTKRSKK